MEKLVLVTRPIEQARQFAADIDALGAKAIIEPMLTIVPVAVHWDQFSLPDAILLTSPQALKAQHFPERFSDIPVFCVGEKTLHLAEEAGAHDVVSGDHGIESVYPLLRERIAAGSKILYVRGDVVSQDVPTALSEYRVQEAISYKSVAIDSLSHELHDLFSRLHTITLFSPRTGAILKVIMTAKGLIKQASNINLLCLSPSVLDSVRDIHWKSAHVAETPTQNAMTQKLKILIQD